MKGEAMYSQATVTRTIQARKRLPQRDNIVLSVGGWEERAPYAGHVPEVAEKITGPEGAERDRQASLEFLHRLVMG